MNEIMSAEELHILSENYHVVKSEAELKSITVKLMEAARRGELSLVVPTMYEENSDHLESLGYILRIGVKETIIEW